MKAGMLIGAFLTAAVALVARPVAAQRYEFEALGKPVVSRGLSFRFVTQDPDGHYVAWTGYEGTDRQALLGVRTDNGELIWVDLADTDAMQARPKPHLTSGPKMGTLGPKMGPM